MYKRIGLIILVVFGILIVKQIPSAFVQAQTSYFNYLNNYSEIKNEYIYNINIPYYSRTFFKNLQYFDLQRQTLSPLFSASVYHPNIIYNITQDNMPLLIQMNYDRILQYSPVYSQFPYNYPYNFLFQPYLDYSLFYPSSFPFLWNPLFGYLFSITIKDSDGDGVPDKYDSCSNDSQKVYPGICGCNVPDKDIDEDGIFDCKDQCPNDHENDIDSDGFCGDIDNCPYIFNPEQKDTDRDGLGDACDPNTFKIKGFVSGNGLPVSGANVKIGPSEVATLTNIYGVFEIEVGISELINHPDPDDPNSKIFLITVKGDGFAIGYYNLHYKPHGDPKYYAEIKLIGLSYELTQDDDVTDINGVDIVKEGEKIGELFIPSDALFPGVTQVTGTVTYIDPTTSDLYSFPGMDFQGVLAVKNQSVLLENLGVMYFDLKNQNGESITRLNPPATVCMKIPSLITGTVSVGNEIPLWYYDPNRGIWQEEGFGIVEDRGTNELWICGEVSHLTEWGINEPIFEHACFKFYFVDINTGDPIRDLSWYAEGITYNGISPESQCDCVYNDPPTPCLDGDISSFTMKKSTLWEIEKIRVYTIYRGDNYYLIQNGDGTYMTTTDPDIATEFDVPGNNASCLNNYNILSCSFLDKDDPTNPTGSGCEFDDTLPICGNNGILPLMLQTDDEEINGFVEGIIYGTEGTPLPNAEVTLIGEYCNFPYNKTVSTDAEGFYRFDNVPCCKTCDDSLEMFNGKLKVSFDVEGTIWDYTKYNIYLCCCNEFFKRDYPFIMDFYYLPFECETSGYLQNIYLPVVWGEIQGTAYNAEGTTELVIEKTNEGRFPEDYSLETSISINTNGQYGPIPVPVGKNYMYTTSESKRILFMHEKNLLITADIGPSAKGTVTGIVYNDSGIHVDEGIKVILNFGSDSVFTNHDGIYIFNNVPIGYVNVTAVLSPTENRSNMGILNHNEELLNIHINGSGCTVTGTLYDWIARPLSNTDVYIQLSCGSFCGQNFNIKTDENGIFTFGGLRNGIAGFSEIYSSFSDLNGYLSIGSFGINQACQSGSLIMDLPLIFISDFSPAITTIRHIRGDTAYDNLIIASKCGSYNYFDIIGKDFGYKPETVSMDGLSLPIEIWEKRRIRIKLEEQHTSGPIEIILPNIKTVGPIVLINQGEKDIKTMFSHYLIDYASTENMGNAWLDWFLDPNPPLGNIDLVTNLEHFSDAYQRNLIEGKEVTIAYCYRNSQNNVPYERYRDFPLPPGIDPDSLTPEQYELLQEKEHMKLLEKWLEAVFPGYNLELIYEGSERFCDVTIYANCDQGIRPTAAGNWVVDSEGNCDFFYPRIRARHEGVIAHEFGHFLGLHHHYINSVENLYMPPGESECRFNQTGNNWCSACSAAMGLGHQDVDTANALLLELREYIDDTPLSSSQP